MSLHTHNAIGWLMVIATLGLIGFWIPPAVKGLGESYLIFFFHFPSAVNCLNFFVFAGIISLLYLLYGGRDPRLDLGRPDRLDRPPSEHRQDHRPQIGLVAVPARPSQVSARCRPPLRVLAE